MTNPASEKFYYLDIVRGGAALLVCISHARAFVFLEFAQAEKHSIILPIFYFLTGLGHQAVIVFFVLSGVMISNSVLSQNARGMWSWTQYSIDRLSRLWTVLLPALLLTCFWDNLGLVIGNSFYSGQLFDSYHSGPSLTSPLALGAKAFFYNLLFLQTSSLAPVYGSNGPLWSLANEFWYYVLFPLLYFGIRKFREMPIRHSAMLVAAVCICIILPRTILLLWPTWLVGLVTLAIVNSDRLKSVSSSSLGVAFTTSLFSITICISRYYQGRSIEVAADYALAAGCAIFFSSMISINDPPKIIKKIGKGLSNISYSLYLTHFPLLAFLSALILQNRQVTFGIDGICIMLLGITCSAVYSVLVYFIFERKTPIVRSAFSRCFVKKPRKTNTLSGQNARRQSNVQISPE